MLINLNQPAPNAETSAADPAINPKSKFSFKYRTEWPIRINGGAGVRLLRFPSILLNMLKRACAWFQPHDACVCLTPETYFERIFKFWLCFVVSKFSRAEVNLSSAMSALSDKAEI